MNKWKTRLSESSWHSVNYGITLIVTPSNICVVCHGMSEHLCAIGMTSMTAVQMVTGCDHLRSPVPIHPPLNSSFDALCTPPVLSWSHDHHHFENNTKMRWTDSQHQIQELLTFLQQAGCHELDFLISLFEILMSNCPASWPSAQRLNQIYNYCQMQEWKID